MHIVMARVTVTNMTVLLHQMTQMTYIEASFQLIFTTFIKLLSETLNKTLPVKINTYPPMSTNFTFISRVALPVSRYAAHVKQVVHLLPKPS